MGPTIDPKSFEKQGRTICTKMVPKRGPSTPRSALTGRAPTEQQKQQQFVGRWVEVEGQSAKR